MSNNSNKTWNTKYGPRRVRDEAPTLEEAIAVAQGLSGEPSVQAEIAASLMGLPRDKVSKALQKLPSAPKAAQSVVFTGPMSAPRTVVVERKQSRRVTRTAERALSTI